VSMLELAVTVLTLVTAAVGAWSIYWARTEPHCWRCWGGRILFVINLLTIGGIGLVAAFTRAQGLPPLGLVAGLLTIGMLWERPGAKPGSRPQGESELRLPKSPKTSEI
jgi:hypothetical protein